MSQTFARLYHKKSGKLYLVLILCLLVASFLFVELVKIRAIRYKFLISSTDEAIYTQLAYNFSQGKFFKSTAIPENRVPGETTFFAVHTAPSYLFMFLPYFIFPHFSAIGYWQIIFILAGFIPICLIGFEQKQHPAITFAIAVTYLLSPFLLINTLWTDPTTFSLPIFFWIYYFYETKRTPLLLFCLVLFMGFEESQAPLVVAFGLWMIFKKDIRLGTMVAAVGLIWFLVCVFLIGGFFSSQGVSQIDKVFPLDRTVTGIFHALANGLTWKNFFLMQTPLFLFPLFSTSTYFLSAPFMALFLLSPYQLFYSLTSRYAIQLWPIFIIGTLDFSKKINSAIVKRVFVFGILAIAIFQNVPQFSFGEFNCLKSTWSTLSLGNTPPPADYQILTNKILPSIPGTAKVSASHKMVHFLSERPWVHTFPYFWKDADYLVIDLRYKNTFPFSPNGENFYATLIRIKNEGTFTDVFQSDNFLVLKRN